MTIRLKRRALLAFVLSLSSACLFLWVVLFIASDQTVSPFGNIEQTAQDRFPLESLRFKTTDKKHRQQTSFEPLVASFISSTGALLIPNKAVLRNMTWAALSDLYHRYLNTIQYECKEVARVGRVTDGGWEVCNDIPFLPQDPCVTYSFGVGDDFSFDDAVVMKYGCKVYSFDPSMNMKTQERGEKSFFLKQGLADSDRTLSNGWDMSRFDTIRTGLKHLKTPINIVKLDIEEWEWEVLPDLLASEHLKTVSQVLIELHQCEGCSSYNPKQEDKEPSRDRYLHMLELLSQLYQQNFRIFHQHGNKACQYLSKFTMTHRSACYEISFVKVK